MQEEEDDRKTKLLCKLVLVGGMSSMQKMNLMSPTFADTIGTIIRSNPTSIQLMMLIDEQFGYVSDEIHIRYPEYGQKFTDIDEILDFADRTVSEEHRDYLRTIREGRCSVM